MSGLSAATGTLSEPSPALSRVLVLLTIFLGAFLLFGIEPLIAKMILPWFGGTADVWIASLLFFQTALLGGYLYAHLLTTKLAPAAQWRLHLALLVTSLLFLPVIPSETWKPSGGEEPLPLILGTLAATIGLPFVLLASTGPLIQTWASRAGNAASGSFAIYRLYALSNLGSLLALLLYPVVAEPLLSTRVQASGWSLCYAVFVLLSAAAAWTQRKGTATPSTMTPTYAAPPDIVTRLFWFALALAPSALLLATTNHLLRNIAAIPLLWVVPLALYLVSFIIAFDHPRWYVRYFWYPLFAFSVGAMIFVVGLIFDNSYVWQLVLISGAMFVCCMICHGELAALKPDPRALTSFYLTIAAGGAAGGLLIAVIAPLLFTQDFDLAIVLPSLALLVFYVAWRRVPHNLPSWIHWNLLVGVAYSLTFVTGYMAIRLYRDGTGHVFTARNFYGPLRVSLRPADAALGEMLQLRNGNIVHGREFTAPDRRCEPISYYARQSGIGATMQEKGKQGPLKIGVIGLGAGMIAGYGRAGDSIRFYEINPLVQSVAERYFFYLKCPGEKSIAFGDARLSLEAEPGQAFDVLVVDAFSSDAIPVHLLTLEVFQLYWRHLKPDGVLAVHVSNRHVELSPIVGMAARASGKTARMFPSPDDVLNAVDASVWMLVTGDEKFFQQPLLQWSIAPGMPRNLRPWTDDYSNLWQSLK